MTRKINNLDCILLVDDDEFTNYINQKVIEKASINTHVQTTTSARQALDYLSERGPYLHTPANPQPGIIFLDINMPGMNGWDFLQEFNSFQENQKAKIVIVILTSSNNPQEKEKSKHYKEVVAFWTKPLNPRAVADLVDAHFYRSENSDLN